MAILILVGGIFAAGLIARGEAAGADARAYWAGVRLWLSGGDPYHPTGPFLPYVYAPWMLPLFAPWALLPWDVAWFVWRGAAILLLLWTIHWAYQRRPLPTALIVLALRLRKPDDPPRLPGAPVGCGPLAVDTPPPALVAQPARVAAGRREPQGRHRFMGTALPNGSRSRRAVGA